MSENYNSSGWPDDFDFETDYICQTIFKPFIEKQLAILKDYDEQRNLKSDYVFHQHAYDAAKDVKNTCVALELSESVANNMYYATLIHDLGKPELSPEIWDIDGTPSPEQKATKRQHVNLGAQKFENEFRTINHPFKTLAIDIIKHHHETVNGKGHYGLSGNGLSDPVKLVSIVEHYDGLTHPRPHQIERGDKFDPPSLFEKIESRYEGHFDPIIYEIFKTVKLDQYNLSLSLAPNTKNILDFE